MKIKSVMLSANTDDRIAEIFKQLGAKKKSGSEDGVYSLSVTPDVMRQKVDIAYEQLRRLGYDNQSCQQQHFWYISDKQKQLPTISIESQGGNGFVQERHEYLIYW